MELAIGNLKFEQDLTIENGELEPACRCSGQSNEKPRRARASGVLLTSFRK